MEKWQPERARLALADELFTARNHDEETALSIVAEPETELEKVVATHVLSKPYSCVMWCLFELHRVPRSICDLVTSAVAS